MFTEFLLLLVQKYILVQKFVSNHFDIYYLVYFQNNVLCGQHCEL